MGQEINTTVFKPRDFEEFTRRLRQETLLLAKWVRQGNLSHRGPVGGFELEAWLVGDALAPAAVNDRIMRLMNSSQVAVELARFNVEFNNAPSPLEGHGLSDMQRALEALWVRGARAAAACQTQLLSIGILPTLEVHHLSTDNFTPLNRYFALDAQVMRSRGHRKLRLDVIGREHVRMEHNSMMLEAAGTSFQIHLQAPFDRIRGLYNAAVAVSAPMLSVAANAPYLFNTDLWDESRLPLFEQSLEVGDFGGTAPAPLRRVGLGSGYVHASIMECFEENLQSFGVLLPMLFDDTPEQLSHLRLHNGTVWRWNRPLIGFDEDGMPHVRIEHRVLPGSPSIVDAVSDAALFYGLVEVLSNDEVRIESRLPFSIAQRNLQQAARHGLSARVTWLDGEETDMRVLLLNELLPAARTGLLRLGVNPADCDYYLAIVTQRVENNTNGATWQRAFVERHGRDMHVLTAAYLERQQSGAPVHMWPL